jgi:hypothetical protein
MKKISTLLLLILLVQTSCDKIGKECGECMSPPPTFMFEFVDKDSGENLFTNNTFEIENVSVTDENNEKVEFELMTEDNINVLNLKTVGWNLEAKSYTIKLNDTTSVNFDLNINEKHSECCTYFEVETFEVYDFEYERENNNGFIVVKM